MKKQIEHTCKDYSCCSLCGTFSCDCPDILHQEIKLSKQSCKKCIEEDKEKMRYLKNCQKSGVNPYHQSVTIKHE